MVTLAASLLLLAPTGAHALANDQIFGCSSSSECMVWFDLDSQVQSQRNDEPLERVDAIFGVRSQQTSRGSVTHELVFEKNARLQGSKFPHHQGDSDDATSLHRRFLWEVDEAGDVTTYCPNDESRFVQNQKNRLLSFLYVSDLPSKRETRNEVHLGRPRQVFYSGKEAVGNQVLVRRQYVDEEEVEGSFLSKLRAQDTFSFGSDGWLQDSVHTEKYTFSMKPEFSGDNAAPRFDKFTATTKFRVLSRSGLKSTTRALSFLDRVRMRREAPRFVTPKKAEPPKPHEVPTARSMTYHDLFHKVTDAHGKCERHTDYINQAQVINSFASELRRPLQLHLAPHIVAAVLDDLVASNTSALESTVDWCQPQLMLLNALGLAPNRQREFADAIAHCLASEGSCGLELSALAEILGLSPTPPPDALKTLRDVAMDRRDVTSLEHLATAVERLPPDVAKEVTDDVAAVAQDELKRLELAMHNGEEIDSSIDFVRALTLLSGSAEHPDRHQFIKEALSHPAPSIRGAAVATLSLHADTPDSPLRDSLVQSALQRNEPSERVRHLAVDVILQIVRRAQIERRKGLSDSHTASLHLVAAQDPSSAVRDLARKVISVLKGDVPVDGDSESHGDDSTRLRDLDPTEGLNLDAPVDAEKAYGFSFLRHKAVGSTKFGGWILLLLHNKVYFSDSPDSKVFTPNIQNKFEISVFALQKQFKIVDASLAFHARFNLQSGAYRRPADNRYTSGFPQRPREDSCGCGVFGKCLGSQDRSDSCTTSCGSSPTNLHADLYAPVGTSIPAPTSAIVDQVLDDTVVLKTESHLTVVNLITPSVAVGDRVAKGSPIGTARAAPDAAGCHNYIRVTRRRLTDAEHEAEAPSLDLAACQEWVGNNTETTETQQQWLSELGEHAPCPISLERPALDSLDSELWPPMKRYHWPPLNPGAELCLTSSLSPRGFSQTCCYASRGNQTPLDLITDGNAAGTPRKSRPPVQQVRTEYLTLFTPQVVSCAQPALEDPHAAARTVADVFATYNIILPTLQHAATFLALCTLWSSPHEWTGDEIGVVAFEWLDHRVREAVELVDGDLEDIAVFLANALSGAAPSADDIQHAALCLQKSTIDEETTPLSSSGEDEARQFCPWRTYHSIRPPLIPPSAPRHFVNTNWAPSLPLDPEELRRLGHAPRFEDPASYVEPPPKGGRSRLFLNHVRVNVAGSKVFKERPLVSFLSLKANENARLRADSNGTWAVDDDLIVQYSYELYKHPGLVFFSYTHVIPLGWFTVDLHVEAVGHASVNLRFSLDVWTQKATAALVPMVWCHIESFAAVSFLSLIRAGLGVGADLLKLAFVPRTHAYIDRGVNFCFDCIVTMQPLSVHMYLFWQYRTFTCRRGGKWGFTCGLVWSKQKRYTLYRFSSGTSEWTLLNTCRVPFPPMALPPLVINDAKFNETNGSPFVIVVGLVPRGQPVTAYVEDQNGVRLTNPVTMKEDSVFSMDIKHATELVYSGTQLSAVVETKAPDGSTLTSRGPPITFIEREKPKEDKRIYASNNFKPRDVASHVPPYTSRSGSFTANVNIRLPRECLQKGDGVWGSITQGFKCATSFRSFNSHGRNSLAVREFWFCVGSQPRQCDLAPPKRYRFVPNPLYAHLPDRPHGSSHFLWAWWRDRSGAYYDVQPQAQVVDKTPPTVGQLRGGCPDDVPGHSRSNRVCATWSGWVDEEAGLKNVSVSLVVAPPTGRPFVAASKWSNMPSGSITFSNLSLPHRGHVAILLQAKSANGMSSFSRHVLPRVDAEPPRLEGGVQVVNEDGHHAEYLRDPTKLCVTHGPFIADSPVSTELQVLAHNGTSFVPLTTGERMNDTRIFCKDASLPTDVCVVASVRARAVGGEALFMSQCVFIDVDPPIPGRVQVGCSTTASPVAVWPSRSEVCGNWGETSDASPVRFALGVGQSPTHANLCPFQAVSSSSVGVAVCEPDRIPLNQTVYLILNVTDAAGNSAPSSTMIQFDDSAPVFTRTVTNQPDSAHLSSQRSDNEFQYFWSVGDPHTSVVDVQVCLGTAPFSADIMPCRSVNPSSTSFNVSDLPRVPNGQRVHCTVHALNEAFLTSSSSSPPTLIENTPPLVRGRPRNGVLRHQQTQVSRSVASVSWSSFSADRISKNESQPQAGQHVTIRTPAFIESAVLAPKDHGRSCQQRLVLHGASGLQVITEPTDSGLLQGFTSLCSQDGWSHLATVSTEDSSSLRRNDFHNAQVGAWTNLTSTRSTLSPHVPRLPLDGMKIVSDGPLHDDVIVEGCLRGETLSDIVSGPETWNCTASRSSVLPLWWSGNQSDSNMLNVQIGSVHEGQWYLLRPDHPTSSGILACPIGDDGEPHLDAPCVDIAWPENSDVPSSLRRYQIFGVQRETTPAPDYPSESAATFVEPHSPLSFSVALTLSDEPTLLNHSLLIPVGNHHSHTLQNLSLVEGTEYYWAVQACNVQNQCELSFSLPWRIDPHGVRRVTITVLSALSTPMTGEEPCHRSGPNELVLAEFTPCNLSGSNVDTQVALELLDGPLIQPFHSIGHATTAVLNTTGAEGKARVLVRCVAPGAVSIASSDPFFLIARIPQGSVDATWHPWNEATNLTQVTFEATSQDAADDLSAELVKIGHENVTLHNGKLHLGLQRSGNLEVSLEHGSKYMLSTTLSNCAGFNSSNASSIFTADATPPVFNVDSRSLYGKSGQQVCHNATILEDIPGPINVYAAVLFSSSSTMLASGSLALPQLEHIAKAPNRVDMRACVNISDLSPVDDGTLLSLVYTAVNSRGLSKVQRSPPILVDNTAPNLVSARVINDVRAFSSHGTVVLRDSEILLEVVATDPHSPVTQLHVEFDTGFEARTAWTAQTMRVHAPLDARSMVIRVQNAAGGVSDGTLIAIAIDQDDPIPGYLVGGCDSLTQSLQTFVPANATVCLQLSPSRDLSTWIEHAHLRFLTNSGRPFSPWFSIDTLTEEHFDVRLLQGGTYLVEVQASDSAGHNASRISNVTIVADSTEPNVGTVQVWRLSGSKNATTMYVRSGDELCVALDQRVLQDISGLHKIVADAAEADGLAHSSHLAILNATDPAQPACFPVPELGQDVSQTAFRVRVRVWDRAGNIGESQSDPIVVSNTPPDITIAPLTLQTSTLVRSQEDGVHHHDASVPFCVFVLSQDDIGIADSFATFLVSGHEEPIARSNFDSSGTVCLEAPDISEPTLVAVTVTMTNLAGATTVAECCTLKLDPTPPVIVATTRTATPSLLNMTVAVTVSEDSASVLSTAFCVGLRGDCQLLPEVDIMDLLTSPEIATRAAQHDTVPINLVALYGFEAVQNASTRVADGEEVTVLLVATNRARMETRKELRALIDFTPPGLPSMVAIGVCNSSDMFRPMTSRSTISTQVDVQACWEQPTEAVTATARLINVSQHHVPVINDSIPMEAATPLWSLPYLESQQINGSSDGVAVFPSGLTMHGSNYSVCIILVDAAGNQGGPWCSRPFVVDSTPGSLVVFDSDDRNHSTSQDFNDAKVCSWTFHDAEAPVEKCFAQYWESNTQPSNWTLSVAEEGEDAGTAPSIVFRNRSLTVGSSYTCFVCCFNTAGLQVCNQSVGVHVTGDGLMLNPDIVPACGGESTWAVIFAPSFPRALHCKRTSCGCGNAEKCSGSGRLRLARTQDTRINAPTTITAMLAAIICIIRPQTPCSARTGAFRQTMQNVEK